jgi:hypothetical protein
MTPKNVKVVSNPPSFVAFVTFVVHTSWLDNRKK